MTPIPAPAIVRVSSWPFYPPRFDQYQREVISGQGYCGHLEVRIFPLNPKWKDMNGTANMEATMKTLVAILLLTACAVAQNVGKPKTATISASFSKAAVRYLVTVMRPVASVLLHHSRLLWMPKRQRLAKRKKKCLRRCTSFDVTHAMNLEVVENGAQGVCGLRRSSTRERYDARR